jgi:nitrogen fixation NifU-like protein
MSMDAKLIEHMMNPKNYGELKNSDTQGMGKNPDNGEKVVVYMHIGTDEEVPYVENIHFQAIGCTTTIVAGSMLTEEAKGLHLQGVYDLVDATMGFLDKLPPEEAACSEMVALAIKAAVDTYKERISDPDYPMITYQIVHSCEPKEEEKI